MDIHVLQHPEEFRAYDAWIKAHPDGNLWQSLERKKYLESLGKETRIYVANKQGNICGSALVMIDQTSFGLSTWDIPKGPVGDCRKELIDHIITEAQSDKCMALYCSPMHPIANEILGVSESDRYIHCEATRILDLSQTEDEILKQMKPKGRYNIKIAIKNGITVEQSEDIDTFYRLITQTGKRDGFTHLQKDKYDAFLRNIDGSFMLLAFDKNKKAIAGLMGVLWNKKALYYYGASSYAHRAIMAPYLLQWESIQFCKAKGALSYDLLGVTPPDAPASHPWQGITSFKEKFGGDVVVYPPELKIVLKPIIYRFLRFKRKLLG